MPGDRIKGDSGLERMARDLDVVQGKMIALALGRADAIIERRFDIELGSDEVLEVLGPKGVKKLGSSLKRRRGHLSERSLRKEIGRDSHWPHRWKKFGDSREATPWNTLQDVDDTAWVVLRRMVKDNRLLLDAASVGTFAASGSFGAGATVYGAGTILGGLKTYSALVGKAPNPEVDSPEMEALLVGYTAMYKPFAERRHAFKRGRLLPARDAEPGEARPMQKGRLTRREAAREAWTDRDR